MEELIAKIETALFVSGKPLTYKQLARVVDASLPEVEKAVATLLAERNAANGGIHVLLQDDAVQLVTNPAYAAVVEELTNVELDPELTRPSLETLTIIAYRGPVTKPEIETIRGVNCSLIVRNLQLRGLIEERDDSVKMQPVYSLTTDALRFFGVHRIEELPDYGNLHANAKIEQLLASLTIPDVAPSSL